MALNATLECNGTSPPSSIKLTLTLGITTCKAIAKSASKIMHLPLIFDLQHLLGRDSNSNRICVHKNRLQYHETLVPVIGICARVNRKPCIGYAVESRDSLFEPCLPLRRRGFCTWTAAALGSIARLVSSSTYSTKP